MDLFDDYNGLDIFGLGQQDFFPEAALPPAPTTMAVPMEPNVVLQFKLNDASQVGGIYYPFFSLLNNTTFNTDINGIDLNTNDVVVKVKLLTTKNEIDHDFIAQHELNIDLDLTPLMNENKTKLLITRDSENVGILAASANEIKKFIEMIDGVHQKYIFITREVVPKILDPNSFLDDLIAQLPLPTGASTQQLIQPIRDEFEDDDEDIIQANVVLAPREQIAQQNTLKTCVEDCFKQYGVAMPQVIHDGLIGPPSAAMSVALRIENMNQERIDGDVPLPVGNAIAVEDLPPNVDVTEGHDRCMTTLGKQDTAVAKALIALHRAKKDTITSSDVVAYLRSNALVKSYYIEGKSRKLPDELKNIEDEYFVIKALNKHEPMPENLDKQAEWEKKQMTILKAELRSLTKAVARSLVSLKKNNCADTVTEGKYKYSAKIEPPPRRNQKHH